METNTRNHHSQKDLCLYFKVEHAQHFDYVCTSKLNVCKTNPWNWEECHDLVWNQVAATQCLWGHSWLALTPELFLAVAWGCVTQHPDCGPSQQSPQMDNQAAGMGAAERSAVDTV